MDKKEIILLHGRQDGLDEHRYHVALVSTEDAEISMEDSFLAILKLEDDGVIVFKKKGVALAPRRLHPIPRTIKKLLVQSILIALGAFITVGSFLFFSIKEKIENPYAPDRDYIGNALNKTNESFCKGGEDSEMCTRHKDVMDKVKEEIGF